MNTATGVIEAPSRQLAMDWSLVLTSQGIECVIEQRADDGAWQLLVADEDESRALDAIRAYERENGTPWRTEMKWTGQLFDWRCVFWWLLVIALFWAGPAGSGLEEAGIMSRASFLHGEWWRAFTAVTLHADVGHLMLNVASGVLLLGLAMGCYGAGAGLLAAFLSGAMSNAIEALVRQEAYRGLGASGMVMGALGLLAAHSMTERGATRRQWLGRGVLAAALLLMMLGLDPRSDVLAHVLGFMCGGALGILGNALTPRGRPRWFDVSAGITAAALVAGTWAVALRAG